MTSIKHTPGATPPITAPTGAGAAAPTPEAGRADFRAELETTADAARSTGSDAARAEATGLSPALAEVSAQLRAGAMTPAQAVERMLSRALESPMTAGLNPSARTELEAKLRDALASDPSLKALVEDLGKAR